jgi:hypothetical protein
MQKNLRYGQNLNNFKGVEWSNKVSDASIISSNHSYFIFEMTPNDGSNIPSFNLASNSILNPLHHRFNYNL